MRSGTIFFAALAFQFAMRISIEAHFNVVALCERVYGGTVAGGKNAGKLQMNQQPFKPNILANTGTAKEREINKVG